MSTCENCLGGSECADHVLGFIKSNSNEDYYKAKELIETQTHDKLKEFLYNKLHEHVKKQQS